MADSFKALQVKRYPKLTKKDTSDSKYWKKFQFPITVKENSAINYVDFSQVKPHDYIVTCSGKIQIFSQAANEVKKCITRFKDNVYGARFRSDAKLLTAGLEDGTVQVFDVSSKTVLRQFKGHTKATHVTSFSPNNTHVFSASDDKTVRCWDIPTEKPTSIFKGHEDYIRTGMSNPATHNIFVTGSYDHTVKLWDNRSEQCTLTVEHGSPVESVAMFPNGGICLSSGGNYIRVWDILSGGKLLFSFSNHQKTITTMCFDGSYTRLLSGSLDRHVKIYDVKDYSVVSSIDYPSSILSMGLSPDGSHLIVGMSDGLISIKKRPKPKEEEMGFPSPEPRHGTYRYFVRGQSYKSEEGDYVVKEEKIHKPGKVDKLLKKFEYKETIDSVLKHRNAHPPVVISVIHELARRDVLKSALSGRDADSLEPLMYFIVRHIANPRYSNILADVSELILDIYSPIIGQSSKVDYVFRKLRDKLSNELSNQSQSMETLGALDTLLAASAIHRTSDTIS